MLLTKIQLRAKLSIDIIFMKHSKHLNFLANKYFYFNVGIIHRKNESSLVNGVWNHTINQVV